MKILLLGSGGREHAIAWRLCQDDPSLQLFTAPGNAGTAKLGTNLSFAATDFDKLIAWADKEKPDLTVVGPEAPLCAGVVDRFEKEGLPIFGPNAKAARLEGSKVFSKKLLLKHGLPTAPGECFTDSKSAHAYIEKKRYIKRDLLLDSVQSALLAAARESFGPARDLTVSLDPETGKITAIAKLLVVEKVAVPHDEISVPKARAIKPDAQIGDTVEVDINTRELGRKAAQIFKQALNENDYPIVLKADGLAAGKGVIIAQTPQEAAQTIDEIMDKRIFGEAGAQLVIEECSYGREMSVHVVTDGISHFILPIAQDHKRIGENDTGLNTGGMGAYAPAPFATPELIAEISEKIVDPTLAAFRKEGIDFRGILYIGLMWTKSGPSIIEFNVRGGDPETQVLLPLLDTPLVEVLQAVRERRLGKLEVKTNNRHVVSVVMAAAGYPGTPETGAVIEGLDVEMPDTYVFHAGTKSANNRAVTSGGRMLAVTAWAGDLAKARELAYQRVAKIHFAGSQHRRDIAARLTLE